MTTIRVYEPPRLVGVGRLKAVTMGVGGSKYSDLLAYFPLS